MKDENLDVLQLISQFIPNEYKIMFLKSLLEIYGSIYKTSKITKISRPTLYRYLASDKESYPNDSNMAKILKALIEVKRSWTKDQLRQLAKDFNELINRL
ncbi:MAG: hypothetical protein QXW80_04735 [Candidatus Micrarchaeia archaeon]